MALSIDGTATGISSGSTITTATLSTSNGGNIIVVTCFNERTDAPVPLVTSVASPNLPASAWKNRAQLTKNTGWSGYGSYRTTWASLEIWWAYSEYSLTSEIITVTWSQPCDDSAMCAFGVTGFTGTLYKTSPWDLSPTLPSPRISVGGSIASCNVGTLSSSTMVFGVLGLDIGSGTIVGTNVTYDGFFQASNSGGSNWACNAVEYVNLTAPTAWQMIQIGTQVLSYAFIVDALSEMGGVNSTSRRIVTIITE